MLHQLSGLRPPEAATRPPAPPGGSSFQDAAKSPAANVKNEPGVVKFEPGSVKSEPRNIKSEPGSVKSEPRNIKSEPGSRKFEPGKVKSELESFKFEPRSVKTELPVRIKPEPEDSFADFDDDFDLEKRPLAEAGGFFTGE